MKKSLALALLLLSGGTAHAALSQLPANECEINSGGCINATQTSDAGTPYSYYYYPSQNSGTFVGARSQPGAAPYPVDAFNFCRYIDNINAAGESYFVPFRSQNEWVSFLNAPHTNRLQLTHCARQTAFTAYTNPPANCPSPSASNLPYARTGTTLSFTKAAVCPAQSYTSNVTHVTTWGAPDTIPVHLKFSAGDSDVTPPGWTLISEVWDRTIANVYPACNPNTSVTRTSTACSRSCGGGTANYIDTDACGGQANAGSFACNTQSCWGWGGGGGHGGGGGGNSGMGGYGGTGNVGVGSGGSLGSGSGVGVSGSNDSGGTGGTGGTGGGTGGGDSGGGGGSSGGGGGGGGGD